MFEEQSSSDSEDCYGNIVQKFQNIKKKYENNVESVNDNESVSTKITKQDCDIVELSHDDSLSDSVEIDLDLIIAQNSMKRTRRGRKVAVRNCPNTSTNTVTSGDSINKRGRKGRGKGANVAAAVPRSRRGRSHNRNNRLLENLPIYSIGNTDEYIDKVDNIELFKQKPNDVITIDDEPIEDIEEISVKIYWQSIEIIKFMLRKYQKFTSVFEYFSKKENVSVEKLFFMYNDNIVTIQDTPESIDYNVGKFIEGGILNNGVSQLVKKPRNIKKTGINLKFQCMKLKKPYETTIEKDEKLHIAMVKFAEEIETDMQLLKFYFDGDQINGKLTPNELELEGGECIDVKITN